ncbi:hypothetical protein M0812_28808 [Anaeramoeba flamelloides]|uniref:Cation efflux protein transmembrane domain-containing protein n=1 Tax=Anaeramoeba flamelloides TaxID=1746091 RepID=A0AAV7YFV9_9EUKA|nr:hypothetical protein M0812_28808 [Anaeramoeba flamelloides]
MDIVELAAGNWMDLDDEDSAIATNMNGVTNLTIRNNVPIPISHEGAKKRKKKLYFVSFLLTSAMLGNVYFGLVTHSKTLMANGFHILADLVSCLIAILVITLFFKQSSSSMTYGWIRAGVMGGMINATMLVALVFAVFVQILRVFVSPTEIKYPELVLMIGIITSVLNLISLYIFRGFNTHHEAVWTDHNFTTTLGSFGETMGFQLVNLPDATANDITHPTMSTYLDTHISNTHYSSLSSSLSTFTSSESTSLGKSNSGYTHHSAPLSHSSYSSCSTSYISSLTQYQSRSVARLSNEKSKNEKIPKQSNNSSSKKGNFEGKKHSLITTNQENQLRIRPATKGYYDEHFHVRETQFEEIDEEQALKQMKQIHTQINKDHKKIRKQKDQKKKSRKIKKNTDHKKDKYKDKTKKINHNHNHNHNNKKKKRRENKNQIILKKEKTWKNPKDQSKKKLSKKISDLDSPSISQSTEFTQDKWTRKLIARKKKFNLQNVSSSSRRKNSLFNISKRHNKRSVYQQLLKTRLYGFHRIQKSKFAQSHHKLDIPSEHSLGWKKKTDHSKKDLQSTPQHKKHTFFHKNDSKHTSHNTKFLKDVPKSHHQHHHHNHHHRHHSHSHSQQLNEQHQHSSIQIHHHQYRHNSYHNKKSKEHHHHRHHRHRSHNQSIELNSVQDNTSGIEYNSNKELTEKSEITHPDEIILPKIHSQQNKSFFLNQSDDGNINNDLKNWKKIDIFNSLPKLDLNNEQDKKPKESYENNNFIENSSTYGSENISTSWKSINSGNYLNEIIKEEQELKKLKSKDNDKKEKNKEDDDDADTSDEEEDTINESNSGTSDEEEEEEEEEEQEESDVGEESDYNKNKNLQNNSPNKDDDQLEVHSFFHMKTPKKDTNNHSRNAEKTSLPDNSKFELNDQNEEISSNEKKFWDTNFEGLKKEYHGPHIFHKDQGFVGVNGGNFLIDQRLSDGLSSHKFVHQRNNLAQSYKKENKMNYRDQKEKKKPKIEPKATEKTGHSFMHVRGNEKRNLDLPSGEEEEKKRAKKKHKNKKRGAKKREEKKKERKRKMKRENKTELKKKKKTKIKKTNYIHDKGQISESSTFMPSETTDFDIELNTYDTKNTESFSDENMIQKKKANHNEYNNNKKNKNKQILVEKKKNNKDSKKTKNQKEINFREQMQLEVEKEMKELEKKEKKKEEMELAKQKADKDKLILKEMELELEDNLKHKKKEDITMHAMYWHILSATLISLGSIVDGILLWQLEFEEKFYFDAIISFIIIMVILGHALPSVKKCAEIFMQGTPKHVDVKNLLLEVENVEGLRGLHDFHLWQLAEGVVVGSVHVVFDSDEETDTCVTTIKLIFHKYDIHRVTIQPEFLDDFLFNNEEKMQIINEKRCLL